MRPVFLVNQANGEQVRVNVRTLVNIAAIRREKRNGRDVVIVPSATMPDDVIMNGILYPADEIAKSFKGLERTPAPLGHPTLNGKFVSASDPEGINQRYIGAWNENVRQEGGRVLLDKVIDVEVANRSEGGKAVLAAIDKGGPIHTSTGLLAKLENVTNATTHTRIARDHVWDHDAILLEEDGAATPDQGVGMMVNAQGNDIEVINSALNEAERDLDWAVDSLARALEKRDRAPILDRMKTAILKALSPERDPSEQQNKDADMTVSKEQFDALSAKVDTLSESIGTTISNAIAAAVKPLTDAQDALVANQKAKDDAELTDLRAKIVKSNLLDEEGAAELTLNAARKLAVKTVPGDADGLTNRFKPAGDDQPGFKLPKGDA